MGNRILIDFDEVPPIGATAPHYRGIKLTLRRVEPWTRKDGTPTHLLEWEGCDGQRYVSGLRARSAGLGTIDSAIEQRAQMEAVS